MSLTFENVSFTHDAAAVPLFAGISLHCESGWTGIVGANGTGKTTLLGLAAGELSPDAGFVRRPAHVAYCPQRTDFPSRDVEEFLASLDSDACRLRGVFGASAEWRTRWDTLSHGERKRAQIGAALLAAPDALLLDEPTNHLDEPARRQVLRGLRLFRGTGLLVSHDRDLLDALCRQCVFLEPPTVVVRPGGYTAASRVHDDERLRAERVRDEASAELARLRREAERRARAAAGADRRRSKRGLRSGDSDARERIDRARATGVDGRAGALARQMKARVVHADRRLHDLATRKSYRLGFRLPGAPSPRSTLLAIPAGNVLISPGRVLEHPALTIGPSDRIALMGPNGCGKSTFVRHLLARLTPGRERIVYLPQEIDALTSQAILRDFHALSHARQGDALTIVSALGSRPSPLLASEQVTPGEIRKLLLALGAIEEPHLIVMDEPTNHLDLPAIECLEQALEGCGAALLLVSHDRRFLQRVTRVRWVVTATPTGSRLEVM